MRVSAYLIIALIVLSFALTACDPPDNGNQNRYYDAGEYGNIYVDDFVEEYEQEYGDEENCGYLNGPCCQDLDHTDIYGNWQPIYYCLDDLDCRADICVEGPEYEAYDPRTDNEYYI